MSALLTSATRPAWFSTPPVSIFDRHLRFSIYINAVKTQLRKVNCTCINIELCFNTNVLASKPRYDQVLILDLRVNFPIPKMEFKRGSNRMTQHFNAPIVLLTIA